MEDQDKRTEDHSQGNGSAEITQVGQVIRDLATSTQRLATQGPQRAPATTGALRERIALLVAALGDPSNPLHQQAVNDLVVIGDAAVPALNEALNPRRPWLTAYRAAEALGQIGDGRATGALIEALRHPNSNVRWSAVRSLSALGDARALLDLRRVARDDRGKTSWGEPVADAAQSALDQMRTQNVLLRGADLVKTALACVLMLVSLIVAWSTVTTLREELAQVGTQSAPAAVVLPPPATPEPSPEPDEAAALAADAEDELAADTDIAPVDETPLITGTVQTTANVRAEPVRAPQVDNRVGVVNVGDEIVFLATTPNREWYRIRLGERRTDGSRITSDDGTGWVIGTLLSVPEGEVPVENPETQANSGD